MNEKWTGHSTLTEADLTEFGFRQFDGGFRYTARQDLVFHGHLKDTYIFFKNGFWYIGSAKIGSVGIAGPHNRDELKKLLDIVFATGTV